MLHRLTKLPPCRPLFVAIKFLILFFSSKLLGLRVTFNVTNPIGHRVQSVHVLCNKCATPTYEPLDKGKMYRMITISFLCRGGDGFTAISANFKNRK